MAQQHIADRPAADSSGGGDNNYAENIHFPAAGGQCSGHGFSGNTNNVQDTE
ncbi:Uncharacterised protein [Klebsiella pneumoniae]|nr:Uncharacterised protein [Klebsiella pneumoniae]